MGVLVADSLHLVTLIHDWLVDVRGNAEGLYHFPVSCNVIIFIQGSSRFISVWLTVALCVHHTLSTLCLTRSDSKLLVYIFYNLVHLWTQSGLDSAFFGLEP
jgi:hypothetical protein